MVPEKWQRRSFFLLPLLLFSTLFFAVSFSDVPASHWAYAAVQSLVEKGILSGLPDGSFQGEAYLTRYQLASVLDKLVNYLGEQGTPQGATTEEDVRTQYQLNTLKSLVESIAATVERIGVQYQAIQGRMDTLSQSTFDPTELEAITRSVQRLEENQAGISSSVSALQADMGGMAQQFQAHGSQLLRLQDIDTNHSARIGELEKKNKGLTTLAIVSTALAAGGMGLSLYLLLSRE
ncbi:MAG TPA: S-layer homology domain-containing protein [Thermotogota bacterium]|nr:S-layer homology domain-containing protein [Thermotogota bacterium]HRW92293.1 S-layer homology domain-containing protein [Thermotogota bacterium]